MICEKCEKPIDEHEPRVDVKEVSEQAVKRYHPACAAVAIARQAAAASVPDVAAS